MDKCDSVRRGVFDALCKLVEGLDSTGMKIVAKEYYFTYKKDGKNFIIIRPYPGKKLIRFSVNLDPANEKLDGKILKRGNIGHHGRILAELATKADLEKVSYLIEKAYRLR